MGGATAHRRERGSVSIEERIAELLCRHALHFERHPRPYACSCGCEPFLFLPDYCAHVASVLTAELGLTQEWAAVDFNFAPDVEVIESTRSSRPDLADRWTWGESSDSTVAKSCRYVTAWEAQS